jgi:hypothetical protein
MASKAEGQSCRPSAFGGFFGKRSSGKVDKRAVIRLILTAGCQVLGTQVLPVMKVNQTVLGDAW